MVSNRARPAASESRLGLCKPAEVGEWTSALETGTKRQEERSQEALPAGEFCLIGTVACSCAIDGLALRL